MPFVLKAPNINSHNDKLVKRLKFPSSEGMLDVNALLSVVLVSYAGQNDKN